MTLHLEILMHICDTLAEARDVGSLKNCALTCSQLRESCQGHLFSRVTLSVQHAGRVQKLWRLLKANPKLGGHIKRLQVSFERSPDYANPKIPYILGCCTSVTSLKLQTLSGERTFPPVWPTALPQATVVALERIIYSPVLTRLEIEGFFLPFAAFFSRCSPALAEVHLRLFENMNVPVSKDRGVKGTPITLRKLSISALIPLPALLNAQREDGQRIFDFSQLQGFGGHCNTAKDVQDIKMLLARHGAPLTKLRLRFSDAQSPGIEDIFAHAPGSSLPCFSTLRFLEANMWISLTTRSNEAPFHGLLVALRRLPERSPLESVVINMSIGLHPGQMVVQKDWLSLATSFTTTRFPCLKAVDVKVETYEFDIGGGSVVAEDLKMLPFKDLGLPFSFNFAVTYTSLMDLSDESDVELDVPSD